MLRPHRFWTLMPELSVTCIAEDNNTLLHCIALRIAIIIRSAPRWTVKLWALQTCSSMYFMYNLLKKVPIPGASRNAALSHCGANNTLPVLTLSVVHAIPEKSYMKKFLIFKLWFNLRSKRGFSVQTRSVFQSIQIWPVVKKWPEDFFSSNLWVTGTTIFFYFGYKALKKMAYQDPVTTWNIL